jgi:hypothetical protein
MTLDEQAVADALHDIEISVPSDLTQRARAGGRRRLIRRRAVIGAGVVAVGAVSAPIVQAFRAGAGSRIEPTQQQHLYPGLYAAPPTSGTQCNAGGGAAPSTHSDLLLLPPVNQALIGSAYVRDGRWFCNPHVALTALRLSGSSVVEGLDLEGPNAPTAEEANRVGPDQTFAGVSGKLPIDGQPALEFTITPYDHTDAYWTEPDGGQWHATVRGVSQSDAVALLDRLSLDPLAGVATLPDAERGGWTVEPAAVDPSPSDTGVVFADWHDQAGHPVDLTVTQGPDRIDQLAAGGPGGMYRIEGFIGPMQFIQVRGHLALLGMGTNKTLFWQEAPDVEVQLIVSRASEAEILQVADSLSLASPNDPRLSRS